MSIQITVNKQNDVWIIEAINGERKKVIEIAPHVRDEFVAKLDTLFTIVDYRSHLPEKDSPPENWDSLTSSAIAFHLINKLALDLTTMDPLAEDLAPSKWESIRTQVMDSIGVNDVYKKLCKLFRVEPVDGNELVKIFDGPCFMSMTGQKSDGYYYSQPLADIVNFAIYNQN